MRWTLSDEQILKIRQRLPERDFEIIKRMSEGWEMVVSPTGLVRLAFADNMEYPNINRVRQLEKLRLIECNSVWKQPTDGERGGWQDFRGFQYILTPSGDKLLETPRCDILRIWKNRKQIP